MTGSQLTAALAGLQHIVLDLDGTLYRGSRLFAATLPFLAQLREANIYAVKIRDRAY